MPPSNKQLDQKRIDENTEDKIGLQAANRTLVGSFCANLYLIIFSSLLYLHHTSK